MKSVAQVFEKKALPGYWNTKIIGCIFCNSNRIGGHWNTTTAPASAMRTTIRFFQKANYDIWFGQD
jgi:hypothetical protein